MKLLNSVMTEKSELLSQNSSKIVRKNISSSNTYTIKV